MSAVMSEPGNGGMTALLKALAGLLGALLMLAALLPLVDVAGGLPPVTRLEVAGHFRHLDPAELRARVQPLLAGTLLGLDLDQLQEAVRALPWVAQARVERVWPDAVRVSVVERVPAARWGRHQLLADDGALFAPAVRAGFESLPELNGPAAQSARVQQAWRDLSARVSGPFAPVALTLSARGEWTARTAGGIELRLGRGDPLDKADVIAHELTRVLAARAGELATVDLRYSNGFAARGSQSPADVAAQANARPVPAELCQVPGGHLTRCTAGPGLGEAAGVAPRMASPSNKKGEAP